MPYHSNYHNFLYTYNQKNVLENKHLQQNLIKGAIAWYPASDTYFDESGRRGKRIPKTDNDIKVGPVPRVCAAKSEIAKYITQNIKVAPPTTTPENFF